MMATAYGGAVPAVWAGWPTSTSRLKQLREDTLLVADGRFEERALMDAVSIELCQAADLLVVPQMHHFQTQTGMAEHIGSLQPDLGHLSLIDVAVVH